MGRTITFGGHEMPLVGPEVKVGDKAPDAVLVRNDMSELKLSETSGVRIIASVPSLDTGLCDKETRTFNEAAAGLNGVTVYTVSMDLPFAQKRWCGAAGVERVITLSDYRHRSFAEAWGTLVAPVKLLARAVFVVDSSNTVTYVQYVNPSTGHDPDYDAALAAARAAR